MIFLLLISLVVKGEMAGRIVSVTDYWPEVASDLSQVTWSHATNSQAALATALSDDTMMIEADVSGGEDGQPIMAHPPETQSDLSLQLFLDTVLQATELGARKGIKLDFKSVDVLQPSLETLKRLEGRLQFPVWLNADILTGPGGGAPVDSGVFLELCTEYFPSASLSTGFTTGSDLGQYTSSMMEQLYLTLDQAIFSYPWGQKILEV